VMHACAGKLSVGWRVKARTSSPRALNSGNRKPPTAPVAPKTRVAGTFPLHN
jgi:hypothetical protein